MQKWRDPGERHPGLLRWEEWDTDPLDFSTGSDQMGCGSITWLRRILASLNVNRCDRDRSVLSTAMPASCDNRPLG